MMQTREETNTQASLLSTPLAGPLTMLSTSRNSLRPQFTLCIAPDMVAVRLTLPFPLVVAFSFELVLPSRAGRICLENEQDT